MTRWAKVVLLLLYSLSTWRRDFPSKMGRGDTWLGASRIQQPSVIHDMVRDEAQEMLAEKKGATWNLGDLLHRRSHNTWNEDRQAVHRMRNFSKHQLTKRPDHSVCEGEIGSQSRYGTVNKSTVATRSWTRWNSGAFLAMPAIIHILKKTERVTPAANTLLTSAS